MYSYRTVVQTDTLKMYVIYLILNIEIQFKKQSKNKSNKIKKRQEKNNTTI